MAKAYAGLLGAFTFALRESRSWLFRSYVVVSAAVGLYVAVLLVLAAVTWLASPVAFGERMVLGVVGLLLLLPLFAPVLIAARRYRRSDPGGAADRWLALAGYVFVGSVVLALLVSDPSPTAVQEAVGPAGARLDRLPDRSGLVPPVVGVAVIVLVVRLTRPAAD